MNPAIKKTLLILLALLGALFAFACLLEGRATGVGAGTYTRPDYWGFFAFALVVWGLGACWMRKRTAALIFAGMFLLAHEFCTVEEECLILVHEYWQPSDSVPMPRATGGSCTIRWNPGQQRFEAAD